MNNASRAASEIPDMRDSSLNASLDRSIDVLEREIGALENISGNIDGGRNPPAAGSEAKQVRPDHTMWKAKRLEDLIGRVGELAQRIHNNISG